MSLHHVSSGELFRIPPLDNASPSQAPSTALVKSSQLEVMRLVLQAGKSVPTHHMGNELTLQCMEGIFELHAHDKVQHLKAGDFVFLEKDTPYALHAIEDASILMTVALHHDR